MTLDNYLVKTVSKKAQNVYGWIDLVINTDQAFSFVENKIVNKYITLDPISSTSLLKYLTLVANEVNCAIKDELPPTFGIIFDGKYAVFCSCWICTECLYIQVGQWMETSNITLHYLLLM
jgi:hypothetical protein